MYEKLKEILNGNKGFSLVESILVVAIIGFAIVASFNGFMVGLKAYGKDMDMNDIQYEVRRAATDIAEELKFATEVSSTTLNSGVLNINTRIDADSATMSYNVTGNTLEFTVWGEKNGMSYEVTREVYLNNINLEDGVSGTGVIYYDLPAGFVASNDGFKSSDASLKSFTSLPAPENWDEFTSLESIPTVYTFEMDDDGIPDFTSIETSDNAATYAYTQAKAFPDNLDYSRIVVTAEDGSEKTYKFYFEDKTEESEDAEETYEVSFDLNGGGTTVPSPIYVGGGETISTLPDNPERSGYEFSQWNTEDDGSGILVDESYVVNGDITAYAIWLERHTISFDLDGGTDTGLYGSFEVTDGNRVESIVPPSKAGHIFDGWKDGNGNAFTTSIRVYEDKLLTAQWIEEVSLDFSDAEAGDYFSKDGKTWQKISATKMLCAEFEGKGKWETAKSISISESEYLSVGSLIVDLDDHWWLNSTVRVRQGNRYVYKPGYVDSAGNIKAGNENNNNIRRFKSVDPDSGIIAGDGTSGNPYVFEN